MDWGGEKRLQTKALQGSRLAEEGSGEGGRLWARARRAWGATEAGRAEPGLALSFSQGCSI